MCEHSSNRLYGLYLLNGKPVFLYNLLDLERSRWEGPEVLAPGKHTVVFDFKYDGPGFGKSDALKVDDREVANKEIPHTIPFLMPFGETFDIGSDTRSPVSDTDYQLRMPQERRGPVLCLLLGRQEEATGRGSRDP